MRQTQSILLANLSLRSVVAYVRLRSNGISNICAKILKMNCLEDIGEVEKVKPSITSYVWKVTNFNALDLVTGAFVTSPTIPTDHPDIKWRLVLFPHGREGTNRDKLSLFIQFFSKNKMITEITANVRFGLLNARNKVVIKHRLSENKYKLLPETEFQNRSLPRAAGRENFTTRNVVMNEINEVLQNNALRFSCEILSYDPVFTVPLREELNQCKFRLQEFDDFKKLLNNEKFSDVIFIVDDRKIWAHKVVLVSRSAVFRAMFDCDMQESQQNTVEIVDIKYEVMKELLRFMYAGSVDNIDRMACDLLLAADKYCISGLKLLCEETLSRDLNVDNVLECLTVADMCNSVSLKTRAIEFIVNNASEVIERDEFVALHPNLMCEITRNITRNRKLANK